MATTNDMSIRTKLILLVAITILLTQTISLGLSVWHEMSRFAVSKKETMFATAEIIAAASAKPLAHKNSDEAYQAIRAIGRINGMTFAGLEDASGQLFADVGATEQLASDISLESQSTYVSPLQFIRSKSIEVSVPVIYSGEVVGKLRLVGEAGDLPHRIWAAISATTSGALIALGLALGLVFKLQSAITKPLKSLSDAMARVTRSHNFSIDLPKERNDEVGVLVEGFNDMMTNIRDRDDRLTAHRVRLEFDIAERTKDYQQAAADAKSANAAKSDFLATMSHEIRTPMNGILVMSELLATANLPLRERRQAEVIARSGNSLLAIINDILDFSKIEAGKLEVESIDIDAAVAIDTVLHLFADKAQSKGLDLAVRFELNRDAGVIADPVRLGQVLSNLLNNALKFTETGGVTIEVKHSATRPGHIEFGVVDTGIGIAAEKLATIFEAFSQADQTTTRKFGGTGLGLSIAQKLVAAMGGELAVTSEIGVGTRFYFSIPASQIMQGKAWHRMDSLHSAILCITGRQSEATLASTLSGAGYNVTLATSESLIFLAKDADLVIADAMILQNRARLQLASTGAVISIAKPNEDVTALLNSGRIDATLNWPLLRTDISDIIESLSNGTDLRKNQATSVINANDYSAVHGMSVLVADDSEVNREVAQAALLKLGITPDFVHDGREAFHAVFAKHFDLVLMDGSMPDIDGFESSRMIRERELSEGRERTNIVALTAHVIGSTADAWRDAGMDGVLHKPFTLAQMFETLRSFALDKQVTDIQKPPPVHQPSIPVSNVIAPIIEPMSEPAILDLSVLSELRQMTSASPEVANRIIRLYCAQTDEHFASIINAVREKNLKQLAEAAHALKSMSYNVGATRVASMASEIERSARDMRTPISDEKAEALNQELVQVKDALLRQIA